MEREVIEAKLRSLSEYLEDLKEFESVSLAEYKTDKKNQRFVERTLHLACESCIDIAAHLISKSALREPRDNKDLFEILYENKILREQNYKTMVKMAKFRNIIVHDYARIDPEIVIGILKNNLSDFNGFARDILSYMDTQENKTNC